MIVRGETSIGSATNNQKFPVGQDINGLQRLFSQLFFSSDFWEDSHFFLEQQDSEDLFSAQDATVERVCKLGTMGSIIRIPQIIIIIAAVVFIPV